MTIEQLARPEILALEPYVSARMQASAAYLANYPPDWDAGPNTYYWYYATLALFQHQGPIWEDW